jgi:osmotically-inducible protein OsmY
MRLTRQRRRASLGRVTLTARGAASDPRPAGGILFGFGLLAGALAILLDRRRRHIARDRVTSAARGALRLAEQLARYTGGVAKGAAMEATAPARQGGREYDDVTVARKVETELLRPADAPKGAISGNAHDGVVELRGQVKRPEDVKRPGATAASVAGVSRVDNLLHTPRSEAKHSPPGSPDEVRERAGAPSAPSQFSGNPATTPPADEPMVQRARGPGATAS